jgi:hypothetical protein
MTLVLRFLPVVIRVWPVVIDVVRTVEQMRRAESGEVKKALAKRLLQERVPNLLARYGMSEKDWDNLLGGLIDAAVAVLNWRGKW